MNVAFDRRTALGILRAVRQSPRPGVRGDRDVRVVAQGGKLYFVDSHTAAACDALVLEGGAFWVRRAFLEKVLRSFVGRKILIVEADAKGLRIGRFLCSVASYEAAPEPPPGATYFPPPASRTGTGQ